MILGNIHFMWMLLFFVLPFLLLIYSSFKEYEFGLHLKGLTFLNYAYLFSSSLFWHTLITSILLSTTAMILTIFFSIIIVILIYNIDNDRIRNIIIYIMATCCVLGVIPRTFANSFFLPGTVSGWYSRIVSLYSIGGMFLTYFCIYAPLAILILITFRDKISNDYLYISRELGANNFQVQMQVILPMMKSGITISSLLTFLLIIGDVTVIDIIGGNKYYTTPMYIVDRIKIDDWGSASAAAIIMILLVIFVLSLSIIYLFKDENN